MNRHLKLLIIITVFILILSACSNKDSQENDENIEDETDQSEENDKDNEDNIDEKEKQEEKDKKEREEKEAKEAQKREEEEKDSKNDKSSITDMKKSDGSNDDEDDKEYSELEAADEDLEIVQDDAVTKDEDLKLSDILGTARVGGDGIVYDEDKGYHVLHLQTGLSSYSNSNVFKEKWIAFALPNGVSVPDIDEVPSGVVIVTLPDGHKGVAVKIPSIDGISSETIFLDLPLIGKPDDNHPNNNLYLFNVDGNKHSSQLIGEISSQRNIDFTELEEK